MFKRYPTPQTVWMSCGFEGSSSSLSRRRLTCTDVTGDILPIFQGKIELIERGALDGLTREDIARFAPRGDDYVLVSRLCDGSSVTFGESYTVDRLQNGIRELEREGAAAIMVFCTVHIAFGTNTSFGGTNKADCHMDGIILKPTLYLDGRKIIDRGEFWCE